MSGALPARPYNPNIPSDLETFRGGMRGYFPQYFATKLARNSATSTYLLRAGNAGKTGMQAYVGELRANTVYLPTVGWRFVSQTIEDGIVQRGYGTGAVVLSATTFVDSGGLELSDQLVGTKIRMHSQYMMRVDGNSDQTVVFAFTGSGFTRDTVDPANPPRRIIGSVSPDKYHVHNDFQQFSITSPTVSMRLNISAGTGPDRLVVLYALSRYTVAHDSPAA
jgi:hypothetical protein